jgi:hypothetical protein
LGIASPQRINRSISSRFVMLIPNAPCNRLHIADLLRTCWFGARKAQSKVTAGEAPAWFAEVYVDPANDAQYVEVSANGKPRYRDVSKGSQGYRLDAETGAYALSTLMVQADFQGPTVTVGSDQTVTVGLDLPTGVVPVGDDTVVVTIKLRPITETRTFSAGIRLVGAKPNLTYDVAVDSVLLTVGGSSADLDRMSGATLVVDVDVTGLTTGVTDVPVTAVLPAGTTLVAASPEKVQVTITGPASPSASPAVVEPSASPVAGG